MSTKKPASLTSAVITTKGRAAPSAQSSASAVPVSQEVKKESRTSEVRIAVTVRLSEDEYRMLKLHGINTRKSNQDIILEALSTFLPKG